MGDLEREIMTVLWEAYLPMTVREVELKKSLPAAEAKDEEARLLLAAMPDRAVLVALDEHGRDLDSAA